MPRSVADQMAETATAVVAVVVVAVAVAGNIAAEAERTARAESSLKSVVGVWRCAEDS